MFNPKKRAAPVDEGERYGYNSYNNNRFDVPPPREAEDWDRRFMPPPPPQRPRSPSIRRPPRRSTNFTDKSYSNNRNGHNNNNNNNSHANSNDLHHYGNRSDRNVYFDGREPLFQLDRQPSFERNDDRSRLDNRFKSGSGSFDLPNRHSMNRNSPPSPDRYHDRQRQRFRPPTPPRSPRFVPQYNHQHNHINQNQLFPHASSYNNNNNNNRNNNKKIKKSNNKNNNQNNNKNKTDTSISSNMATSAISFNETNHGRERRIQRAIPTREIQAAIKYGSKTIHPNNNQLLIFKYDGKEHIVTRDNASLVTTMVKTVLLDRKKLTKKDKEDHEHALSVIHGRSTITKTNIKRDDDSIDNDIDSDDMSTEHNIEGTNKSQHWKSHSVIIVDKSGSMRNSDVNGSRTRFGAVWLSLAQDYIEHRIKTGLAGPYDVISIILMSDKAEILIDRWPTNYVMYNKLVDIFYQSEEADRLWKQKDRNIKEKKKKKKKHHAGVNKIKKKLNNLVRAQGHGCYGPSLLLAEELIEKNDNGSSALSLLLLSDGKPSDFSMSKQTDLDVKNTLKDTTGRMASRFGRRFNFSTIGMGSKKEFGTLEALVDAARDFGGIGTFRVPSMSCAEIGRAISSVATSLTATQTELTASKGRQQRRVRQCIRESRKLIPLLTEVVSKDDFDVYMGKAVEHYEYRNNNDGTKTFYPASLQHPDAAGVAMKRQLFGEGQERFAFQFFEVSKDGFTVVGDPLVAKESRFVQDSEDGNNNWKARDKFAKRFCKVQMSARNTAQEFNKKLDSIVNLDPDTARVSFLNCSIYYLTDPEKGEFSVIVERKLDGQFQKWNNNNGWHIGKDDKNRIAQNKLPTVTEDDENEATGTLIDPIEIDNGIFVKKEEVAQAFSHFSYIQSGKKMLICDLQGVYDSSKNILNFTDPVIHYHDARKEGARSKGVYGRTDMGQKGIHNFFHSHECNCLCDLVTKGFINVN